METLVPAAPVWVKQRRDAAAKHFAAVGFPNTRLEDWRFTNVSPIAEANWPLAQGGFSQAAALTAAVSIPGAVRLVIVNGRFAAGHYHPLESSFTLIKKIEKCFFGDKIPLYFFDQFR